MRTRRDSKKRSCDGRRRQKLFYYEKWAAYACGVMVSFLFQFQGVIHHFLLRLNFLSILLCTSAQCWFNAFFQKKTKVKQKQKMKILPFFAFGLHCVVFNRQRININPFFFYVPSASFLSHFIRKESDTISLMGLKLLELCSLVTWILFLWN